MKYQVGDIVLILHSNEEAKVVDIINDKMLMVETRGVSYPVYKDQVDFPYFKRFTEKKQLPLKKEKKFIDDLRREKQPEKNRKEDGVWLTFLPVMDQDEFGDLVVEELKLHLVNNTKQPYLFTYKLHFFGKPDFELKNTVHPFEDFYLHDIEFAELNDSPSFDFEFSLVKPEKTKAPHYEAGVRLKPKQLFAKIEELKKQNLATFSHKLFDVYPDKQYEDVVEADTYKTKLEKAGFKVYDASKARQHMEPARTVVDLHIEKLTDHWEKMDNYEMLSLQLKAFEKYYHLAVVHHQPQLTVIHGVGEGVLRDEIHAILRRKKEVSSFANRHHPAYGYGATEIFFRY